MESNGTRRAIDILRKRAHKHANDLQRHEGQLEHLENLSEHRSDNAWKLTAIGASLLSAVLIPLFTSH